MGKDYYKILGINKNADKIQIAHAFRMLALKYHPKLSKLDKTSSVKQLCNVCQAYQVLSNDQRRKVYDQHGEKVLKEGGYHMSGNTDDVFQNFFGTTDPFIQLFDKQSNQQAKSIFQAIYGVQQNQYIKQVQDLIVDIQCSLQQLYNGCIKEIKYKKKNGLTTSIVTQLKNINIDPGTQSDYQIVFENLGNQAAGLKPCIINQQANLIFQIKQIPHQRFKRKGNDLYYTAYISLLQALQCQQIQLLSLDGRKIRASFDKIISQIYLISPQYQKIILKQGMPIKYKDSTSMKNYKQALKKGNLIINFQINFPDQLAPEVKEQLIQILSN